MTVHEVPSRYALRVNATELTVDDSWLGESLLYVLRERLGLPGAKNACEQGECGSCSVLVDGALVCSCLVLAASVIDRDIVTVEAMAPDGVLSDVQKAFVDAGAVQCGFCTPGPGDGRARPAGPRSPARRPGDPRGDQRQPVPLHRLRTGDRGGARRRARPPRIEPVMSSDILVEPVSPRRPGDRGSASRPRRPDGVPKVQGRFAFGSDLFAEGMLWGHTLRSPHPHARITSVDIGPALRIGGVYAVLTADDVPGSPTYGLESPDQPVLARDQVRFMGEPVAVVAADHPETARRAAAAIRVSYEPLTPLVDSLIAADAPPIHPDGNVFRHLVIRHGDIDATGPVVVEGTYDVGMQDQAPLGTEAGLAIPTDDGGVDLFVCTQALHNDLDQVSACLGLPPEKMRIQLAGVGGAFGAREDVSLQIHLALLALHTGRPVKMVYNREESFFGHVHRHPAHMWYRHTAATRRHACQGRGPPVVRRRAPTPRRRRRWSRTVRASPPARTGCPTLTSRAGACAPTTRRVAPCAASEPCRPASATRPRWTSWPTPSGWIASTCDCTTPWPRAIGSSPGRCSPAPRPWPR